MITKQNYIDMLNKAYEQYNRLLSLCGNSEEAGVVFVITPDVYAAMQVYASDDNIVISRSNICEDTIEIFLSDIKVFVATPPKLGTFFCAAILNKGNCPVYTGLQRGDLLIHNGCLYSFENSLCLFVETGIAVSDSIMNEYVHYVGSRNDWYANCAEVSLPTYSADNATVNIQSRPQKVKKANMEIEAGDTQLLDEFLKSFEKKNSFLQMGG